MILTADRIIHISFRVDCRRVFKKMIFALPCYADANLILAILFQLKIM